MGLNDIIFARRFYRTSKPRSNFAGSHSSRSSLRGKHLYFCVGPSALLFTLAVILREDVLLTVVCEVSNRVFDNSIHLLEVQRSNFAGS